ncbi:exported protein of unknown function [Candidatus Filomicrobium marinum]|nr:exported protein of unknown function [Candidatus Filomicrobium marinum]
MAWHWVQQIVPTRMITATIVAAMIAAIVGLTVAAVVMTTLAIS